MTRIAVYSPAKDEGHNVAAWAASAADADVVLLADTGSTHESRVAYDAEVYRGTSGHVHRISIQPFRFDDAFNTALALLPENIDIAVPLHLDERLEPGWRPLLEAAWETGARQFTFNYNWAPGVSFRHDRIHARHGFRWIYPAHECLVGPGPIAHTEITVTQHRDLSKDRSHDVELIELGWLENPTKSRPTYYWARELCYLGRWEESRALFDHYLKMDDARFDQERSEACRFLAQMSYQDGRENWLLRSASEAPQRREPWADLATHYSEIGMWQAASGAAARALMFQQTHSNAFHLDHTTWDTARLEELTRL